MSHYHYGDDGDLWVYPPPNEWGDEPEHIEAVRVECQLFVDADDSIAQVRKLQAENAKLRELVQGLWFVADYLGMNPDGATGSGFARQMRELGIEAWK